MRTLFGSLAVAVLAAVATAPTAQSTPPGAPPYARDFGYITTKDGTRLAYVAYLPATKTQVPAVLQYEPYFGGGAPPAEDWLRRGYAVVSVSVRGTACSQGVFDLFGPHEGPDGAEVVEWIARQPWSDRKVGMIGGSYPGHTQILVAAQHPPSLKAIAPSAITASTYDDITHPGGIPNIGFASRWSLLIQPGAAGVSIQSRTAWGDKECLANASAHPPATLIEETMGRPFEDAWSRERSLQTYAPQVKVPTLISQSWQDHETQVSGATTIYAMIKAPKRLEMAPGGHGGAYLLPAVQDDIKRWMDRWLLDKPNGVDRDPPVKVYWEPSGPMGGAQASWTSEYSQWPAREATLRTLYLKGDGDLSTSAETAAAAARSYTFPTGVELVGDNAQFAMPVDPVGGLTWTSPGLDKDTTILGSIEVRFFFSSGQTDTDFDVTLHDVYPNGDVQYLQRGFLRASLRRVDAGRSTPDHIRRPYDAAEPLVPGKVYEVRLTLPPLGAVLRKGHKLQVALLAPSPIPQPDWGLLPVGLPGRNTVYFSSAYPSQVHVPIVPGGAKGPEPACGSLPFQPCRPAPKAPPRPIG